MEERKEKIRGVIGSIVFHMVLLLLLVLLGFSTPLPLPGEEGVEVSLGNDDGGFNNSTIDLPQKATPVEKENQDELTEETEEPAPQEQKANTEDTKDQYITDNNEENPSLNELKPEKELSELKEKENNSENIVKDNKTPVTDTEVKETLKEQTTEKPRSTKHIYTGPKQTDEGDERPEGDTDKPGSGGIPEGKPGIENKTGKGGAGNGISYDLGGRGAKSIPIPPNNTAEIGYIVVSIKVDRNGKVTWAKAGVKGTTISDLELQNLVERYARQAEFNPATTETPEIQMGSITYKFVVGQ